MFPKPPTGRLRGDVCRHFPPPVPVCGLRAQSKWACPALDRNKRAARHVQPLPPPCVLPATERRQALLRTSLSKSAAAAQSYFDDGLVRPDYYLPDTPRDDDAREPPARWGGRGAELLGLTGAVEREAFHNICDNLTPDGERSLTARTKAIRRVGYDLNFHCPKGVSLLHAFTGDGAILTAFRDAVTATMQDLEACAATRVRTKGQNSTRDTRSLIWAEFIHTTTRPVGGYPDPHLHAHCYTFNATFDQVEERWKAAELAAAFGKTWLWEASFHARLAARLAEDGYAIERRGKFFDIAGLPEDLLQKFSRRTKEVEDLAAARGITDPERKAELGARTRRHKSEAKSWPEVEQDWRARLEDDDRRWLVTAKGSAKGNTRETPSPLELIEGALEACLGREARVLEERVLEEALRRGLGRFRPEELRAALAELAADRVAEGGQTYLSASGARLQEQSLIDFARSGRGTCPPLAPQKSPESRESLPQSHREALERAAASIDQVTLIPAVRGKQRVALLGALEECIANSGKSVVRLMAPARQAPENEAAAPLAGKQQAAPAEKVTLVEHAHRFGLRQLSNLFQAAKNSRARLVLETPPPPVRRLTKHKHLSLLERLVTQAGLRSLEARTHAERRHELHSALTELGQGKPHPALQRLTRLRCFKQARKNELPMTIAAAYASAAARGPRSLPIVIAFSNRKQVSDAIRQHLKQRGLLGRERKCEQLTHVHIPDNAKDPASYFKRGQVVQFNKSIKGFKAGQRYKVMGKTRFGHIIARKGAFFEALPLDKLKHFGLYTHSMTELARGDIIRFTASGFTVNERFGMEKLLSKRQQANRLDDLRRFGLKAPERRYRLRKGSHHRVAGYTLRGDIKLDNGWVVPRSFAHFERTHTRSLIPRDGERRRPIWLVDDGKWHWSTTIFTKALMSAWSLRIYTTDKPALEKRFAQFSVAEPAPGEPPPRLPPRRPKLLNPPKQEKKGPEMERER